MRMGVTCFIPVTRAKEMTISPPVERTVEDAAEGTSPDDQRRVDLIKPSPACHWS
jgi:hypothetical protein